MSSEAHRRAVRKWQKKKREQGLCTVCGEKDIKYGYCQRHLEEKLERARQSYLKKKQSSKTTKSK